MTDKQKIELLRKAYEDIIWMAIRYADGRATYAPSMVRESFYNFKKVFPDFKLKQDDIINPFLGRADRPKYQGENDYLFDLFYK